MNLRRGFFRIWLVLSLLWVAGITALGWDNLKRDPVWVTHARFSDEANLILPVNCDDVRGNEVSDYVIAPAVEPWNEYRPISKACWYRQPDFRRLWPEYGDMSYDGIEAALYQKLGWEQAKPEASFSRIMPVGLMAFIPPIALLMAGTLVGWIISGFRTKAS